jgi:hypothetical protein
MGMGATPVVNKEPNNIQYVLVIIEVMDCSDSRTVESEKGTNNLVGGCQLQHSTTIASTGSVVFFLMVRIDT